MFTEYKYQHWFVSLDRGTVFMEEATWKVYGNSLCSLLPSSTLIKTDFSHLKKLFFFCLLLLTPSLMPSLTSYTHHLLLHFFNLSSPGCKPFVLIRALLPSTFKFLLPWLIVIFYFKSLFFLSLHKAKTLTVFCLSNALTHLNLWVIHHFSSLSAFISS